MTSLSAKFSRAYIVVQYNTTCSSYPSIIISVIYNKACLLFIWITYLTPQNLNKGLLGPLFFVSTTRSFRYIMDALFLFCSPIYFLQPLTLPFQCVINGLFGNTSYTYQITTYYTTGAMWVSEEYPFKTTAPKSGEFMMRVQRSDFERKEMFCSVHVCSYVRLFCEDNVPTTYFIYVVHRFCCFFSAAYFKGPFTYCYTDSM